MLSFLARRLGHLVLTLLAASLLLFVVTEFSPGNVAAKILGPYAVQSQVDLLYGKLRLGDPLPLRYLGWLGSLLGVADNPLADPSIGLGLHDPRGSRYFGNFGMSLMAKEPVIDVLAKRAGYTVLLTFWAIVVIVPLSLLLGIATGVNHGRWIDRLLSAAMTLLTSMPEFVTAVGLLLGFAVWLGVAPGTSTMLANERWSQASQLVLPVAVLAIASATYVARIVRASVVDTMRQSFVRTARLKGLTRRQVIYGHVLRNAMIPPVTVILLQVNWLLTGVVVVEAIFAYPGLGSLLLQAALFGDLYTVQALTLIALTVAVVTQVVGDLCYMALDPKIRLT
ncbi:MAG: ABC transporter permease [Proteobacteria bacterium]|nr:ABC transporter permease [Pseudomonadota bacterium]MBI3495940.1 ABC transporter permease [Pseudomonadota bacterium]